MEKPISGYKTVERQGLLWPEPLGNHGHARNVIGNLVEQWTAELVGGRRHKTDSRADYCPDVSTANAYFESKAVGRSKTAFIYTGRLEKDKAFAATNRLVYVIWHHCAVTRQATTVAELEALVALHFRCVYVVPFTAIAAICAALKVEPLNSKYGNTNRPEYGAGYRINLKLLSRWKHAGQCEGRSGLPPTVAPTGLFLDWG